MQSALFPDQQVDFSTLRHRLQGRFGPVRDVRRADPTSQFVYTFIASRTHDDVSAAAFQRLIGRFATWDAIADAEPAEIEAALLGVTYAETKAPDLKRALRHIRARAGTIDLSFLEGLAVEPALIWLEQIHRVARKTAAATLNFSTLRKRAFVVDTHVWRVMRRFGFVGPQAGPEDVYDTIMDMAGDLDADDLYELHWHLKMLGQQVCSHVHANCRACVLSDVCMRRVGGIRPALLRV